MIDWCELQIHYPNIESIALLSFDSFFALDAGGLGAKLNMSSKSDLAGDDVASDDVAGDDVARPDLGLIGMKGSDGGGAFKEEVPGVEAERGEEGRDGGVGWR